MLLLISAIRVSLAVDRKLERLTERFFLTGVGSYGHYQKQRAYTALSYEPGVPRRGSNDSDEDDFVVTPGDNNWADFRLEYIVPIGAARQEAMMTYHLTGGMLKGDGTGGDTWNPLKAGVTTLMVRQYNQLQSFETEFGIFERPIHPMEFGLVSVTTIRIIRTILP